jgi:hypothetical protein
MVAPGTWEGVGIGDNRGRADLQWTRTERQARARSLVVLRRTLRLLLAGGFASMSVSIVAVFRATESTQRSLDSSAIELVLVPGIVSTGLLVLAMILMGSFVFLTRPRGSRWVG